MTYIPRDQVTQVIPNKFEAVRVLSLECRRLNDEMRAREQHTERKITSMAVQRLFEGEVDYYDARERREQERSEAMLAAAEGILDAPPVAPAAESDEEVETTETPATEEGASTEEGADGAPSEAAASVADETPDETAAEAETESAETVDEAPKAAPADEPTEAEAAKE